MGGETIPSEGTTGRRGGALLAAVRAHVARHIGPPDFAFRDRRAGPTPLALLHVSPSERRPFHTLVTSGLSARRPRSATSGERLARFELFLLLDRRWPCGRRAWGESRWGWPASELLRLARLALETPMWLGCGQTLSNGSPPEPFGPGTEYCGALLARPVSCSDDFDTLVASGRAIHFYQWFPLYREELRFASLYGSNALLARFAQRQLADTILASRENVCRPGLLTRDRVPESRAILPRFGSPSLEDGWSTTGSIGSRVRPAPCSSRERLSPAKREPSLFPRGPSTS